MENIEDKKEIKISLKLAIFLFILLILIFVCIGTYMYISFSKNSNSSIDNFSENEIETISTNTIKENILDNSKKYEEVFINGESYIHNLTNDTWNGNYHIDSYYTATANSIQKVVSYDNYLNYINQINNDIENYKATILNSNYYNKFNTLSNYYIDSKSNYIILSYANGSSWCSLELIDCIEKNNEIIIYGNESVNGSMGYGSGYFIAIPTNMPEGTNIKYIQCYSTDEINNLKNYGYTHLPVVAKPIIYLYPEKDTNVSVNIRKPELITCLYPEFNSNNCWNVFAKPNGDLVDLSTNRKLYSLYYESKPIYDFKIEKDGFIVKNSDVANFLEEKLSILGLTERESEEFIVYWLPKLQTNDYNYIRFATLDEINKNMPIEIKPTPDKFIRILMTFKGLNFPIDVEEQQLTPVTRTGFVAVEWGGTKIN